MSLPVALHDHSPDVSQFREEVWAGLSLPQKTLLLGAEGALVLGLSRPYRE